ncbi:MAG: glycosyltransferase family 2 protein [Puia sp.]|nr:glycosyltransferase family 2 protein [Puia sp.]
MVVLKILFWFSLAVVFYSYIGYGILLWVLVRLKNLLKKEGGGNPAGTMLFEPDTTLIVSAWNEEDFIEQKIENTLQLDYPGSKLKLIFITDGSSDNTADIVRRYPAIRLLHQPERRGKIAAMNRAIKEVTTPIVIFSDANTLLNTGCVREMVKHYADPRVGGVAGEKKVISDPGSQSAVSGEGLYWKYESALKKLDSELYSVVGAAGELFSVRTALFEETAENIIIEDFVQSLKICMKGFIIQYEPLAYAMETASLSMKDEEKRKIRICAGAFQAMTLLGPLFNPFRYPVLSFQFLSHRILRWTLCPVCLVILLLSDSAIVAGQVMSGGTSAFLTAGNGFAGSFYAIVWICQVAFYCLALTGWLYAHKNIRIKALFVPYYFLFMNVSVFLGFRRFLKKQQSVLWEKASRTKLT